MTLDRLLETFEPAAPAPGSDAAVPSEAEIERMRSQTYEAGYASGWEDATRADNETRKRIGAELERNIQNLAFTYNEAVDRVRGELKGFVAALLQGFFPRLLPELLREHVRAELLRIAEEMIEAPIEIVCSADSHALITELTDRDFSLEIDLVEDPGLAARQVFVRVAEREIEVDLAPLLGALQQQFDALQNANEEREADNG